MGDGDSVHRLSSPSAVTNFSWDPVIGELKAHACILLYPFKGWGYAVGMDDSITLNNKL
jgi:hypothetical protein